MDDIPRFRELDRLGKFLWIAATPFMALYWLMGVFLKLAGPKPDGVHHIGGRYEVWRDGKKVLETSNATAAANASVRR